MAVRNVFDSDGVLIATYIHSGCGIKEVQDKDPEEVFINYQRPVSEIEEVMVLEKIFIQEGKAFTKVGDLIYEEEFINYTRPVSEFEEVMQEGKTLGDLFYE